MYMVDHLDCGPPRRRIDVRASERRTILVRFTVWFDSAEAGELNAVLQLVEHQPERRTPDEMRDDHEDVPALRVLGGRVENL